MYLLVYQLTFYLNNFWCAERDLNPHDRNGQEILSLSCLPIPPSAPNLQYTRNVKQILIIHGGDSYATYDRYLTDLKAKEIDYERLKPGRRWKDTVVEAFPAADVLTPSMPNSANAQFEEWRILFEKIIPFLKDDTRLIGHSLGAMFLTKYLHQYPLRQPVRQLILLAGGYNDEAHEYGSFIINSATGLEKSADEIHLFHSEDDFVVPFSELAKLQADLPTAVIHSFTDRNHFLDAEFPELIELLQQK